MKHLRIPDLPAGKFTTVIVTQTPVAFTAEQFSDIFVHLQDHFDVETMQTAFACTIPDFGNEHQNDLHLSAHLRAERRPDERPNVNTD